MYLFPQKENFDIGQINGPGTRGLQNGQSISKGQYIIEISSGTTTRLGITQNGEFYFDQVGTTWFFKKHQAYQLLAKNLAKLEVVGPKVIGTFDNGTTAVMYDNTKKGTRYNFLQIINGQLEFKGI